MSFQAWTAERGPAPAQRRRPPRRALEIGGIVLGFIYFWPLAVAYLGWKFMGYPMQDDVRAFLDRLISGFKAPLQASSPFAGTGNSAFEEYRRAELKRLEEERRRLDQEAQAFGDFVNELRRAKDREEFDAFMQRRRGQQAA
jgi:hypothetical protein